MGSTIEIKPHLLDDIEEIDARLLLDTRTFGINADLQRLLTLNTINSDAATETAKSRPGTAYSQAAKRTKSKRKNSISTASVPGKMHRVGAGACGVVIAGDNDSYVMKLAKTLDTTLWNDYRMHAVISEAMARYCPNVHVPKCHYFVPRDQARFFEEHPALPQAVKDSVCLPTHVLVSERIRPLSEAIRTRLIEKYCSSYAKERALTDESNKECLIQLYLGLKNSTPLDPNRFFMLQNCKLHLGQMLELGLDTEQLVSRMAAAYAVMHWGAGTDARDVEFVLGSKATPLMRTAAEIVKIPENTATGADSGRFQDMFWDTTQFWVLDFNKVRSITMDVDGVAQAIEAAGINAPYIPRPRQSTPEEKRLWNTFVHVYLDFSVGIISTAGLGDKVRALPQLFIEGLIRHEEQRRRYY